MLLNAGSAFEQQQAKKLLQWVTFAERHLYVTELREALAIDLDSSCSSIADLRQHQSWSDTLPEFERYVRHLSRGLVTFHDSGYRPRQAKLVHQSLADFFPNGTSDNPASQRAEASHFLIAISCVRYLTFAEVVANGDLPRDPDESDHPLAYFASKYVFEHTLKDGGMSILQRDLLFTFATMRDEDGDVPIIRALKAGFEGIMHQLLVINPSAVNYGRWSTPLRIACNEKRADLIDLLLRKGRYDKPAQNCSNFSGFWLPPNNCSF